MIGCGVMCQNHMYTNKKPDVSVKKLRHKAEIPLIKF